MVINKKDLYSYDFPDTRLLFDDVLQQTHFVLIRMLKIFAQICDKHEITYWADYGTLLGTIREGNIIPWDTDIDIGILASDFQKFKSLGVTELPNDIFFQSNETDKFYQVESLLVHGKLRDKLSSGCPVIHPLSHNGINIDLYVYFFDTENNFFVNNHERLLNASEVHFLPDELDHIEYWPFADTEIPVPKGFDSYLKRCYGDYQELPPEEKRKPLSEVCPTIPCKHYTSDNVSN